MQANVSPFLVGLDIGTSGVRAIAFTPQGSTVAEGRAPLSSRYTANGGAEQQPNDWWLASVQALRDLSAQLGVAVARVAGIGLTGQCPTLALLDPDTGPLGPALLYQDNRATAEAEMLLTHFGREALHRRAGQAASAFYLLPKLLWLRAQGGQGILEHAAIVQPRDLVGWYLTGRLATDPTHAACTLVYDLRARAWAEDWLRELDLPLATWPEILPSCSIQGYLAPAAARASDFPEGLPIITGAADSICAAYGAQAIEPGVLCEVTGTSTCLHMTLKEPASALALNTYPHVLPDLWYAETGLNTTGGALSWLSTLLQSSPEALLEVAASSEPGADGLLFIPHLSSGERDEAGRRGAFIGLQLGSSAAQMTRAVLEGVAYALRQRIVLLEAAGYTVTRLLSCGGNARSPLWAQIKADILEHPVVALNPPDTTTWGAALLVAHTLGIATSGTAWRQVEYTPHREKRAFYGQSYQQFCQLEESIALRETGEQQRSNSHD